ncbi:MAG TPA: glycosyltransferase [Pyrinomonadaceae bacterium]|jgi:glycosyltransferase involved in cell wall biosynthesis|nr:glycosyltransferase [Pyrinomonadaceae bacterium]
MKKKIFHIIPSLRSGGAERQLVEVVSGTSGNGFSHRVCAFRDSDFFSAPIKQAGQEVLELGVNGKRDWWGAARKINSIITDDPPDIIHSWLFDANIAARLVKLRHRKIPLITSLQAPDYDPKVIRAGNWPPAKIEILRWMDKSLAMLTKPHFVACSEFVAGSFRRELGVPPSRMSVIYNSVDPGALVCGPEEPAAIRESLGIAKEAFVYLHIGRLDPQKDHSTLLRAFHLSLAAAPDAHLVMIGEGALKNSLEDLAASLNVEDRVHFLGKRKDIGACLEMANAYVFPSLFEGLPLALLEAMAKGLPCIVSDIEPHREVIENDISGLLVRPASAAELADTMIRIYNDEELRKRLGNEALTKVRDQFCSEVLMPKWEELYEKTSETSR